MGESTGSVGRGSPDRSSHRRTIREFEANAGRKGLRWPAILAVSFGALMLSAGVLLFVAAHWDELSPSQRFTLVLSMVAGFHIIAGILGDKVPSIGIALHLAGTISLGAGIFLPDRSSIWKSIGPAESCSGLPEP